MTFWIRFFSFNKHLKVDDGTAVRWSVQSNLLRSLVQSFPTAYTTEVLPKGTLVLQAIQGDCIIFFFSFYLKKVLYFKGNTRYFFKEWNGRCWLVNYRKKWRRK